MGLLRTQVNINGTIGNSKSMIEQQFKWQLGGPKTTFNGTSENSTKVNGLIDILGTSMTNDLIQLGNVNELCEFFL